jgi:predicted transcriptional regulator
MPREKKEKPPLNKSETAIMKVIYSARRPMTTRDIAEKAGLSWTTARKYLNSLYKKDLVVRTKEGEEVD